MRTNCPACYAIRDDTNEPCHDCGADPSACSFLQGHQINPAEIHAELASRERYKSLTMDVALKVKEIFGWLIDKAH